MNVVEYLEEQASLRPDSLAIIDEDGQISYSQLSSESAKGAAFLRDCGLVAGDAVLVMVPMSIELYKLMLAIWRVGLTVMIIDPTAGRRHIRHCCRRIVPKAFIGIPKAQWLYWTIPELRRIRINICTTWFLMSRNWSGKSGKIPIREIHACTKETPALLTFTSGSTGVPKVTVRTHGFLSVQRAVLLKTLGIQPGQTDLATLPVFALINLASGCTTLIPGLDWKQPGGRGCDTFMRQLQEFRPKSAVASPAFFKKCLDIRDRSVMNCFRRIFTGGAPVFPRLLLALRDATDNCEITAVYGSTEVEPIAEVELSDVHEDDFRQMGLGRGLLAGHLVEEIQCLILEDHWGQAYVDLAMQKFNELILPCGQCGEIVVSGGHILKGYLDGHGDNENKIKVEGLVWHRTGDSGYIDEKGRLWLMGRCSAKIKDGYGLLYPFAVETAVMQSRDIEHCAVLSYEGRRILAVESGLDPGQVKKSLAEIIARFNIEKVHFMKIPLDKRHQAKVDYTEIMKQLKKTL